MAKEVIMPRQGQSVESCILTKWFKEVGDNVVSGDLLFSYETDKAAFEEEASIDGVLLIRYFEEGDEVPVLQNVALIGNEGESIDEFGKASAGDEHKKDANIDAEPPVSVDEEERQAFAPQKDKAFHSKSSETPEQEEIRDDKAVQTGSVKLSPRARKLAREKRVVYESMEGSGPDGRIIERDIIEAIRNGKRLTPLAEKKMKEEGLGVPDRVNTPFGRITSKDLVEAGRITPGVSSVNYTDQPLSNMRKIISSAMYRSLQNSAQLTHHLGANASRMLHLRKVVKAKIDEGYPYNITINDMVCFAVIRALKKHPGANAHFLGDKIRTFNGVNLGLAVDTERGLMVPSLMNADIYSLPELSSQIKKLSESARKGNISPDILDPESGSFTVSNLGNYGVEMFTPVINLPQVAILGVNTIIQRPATLQDGSFGFQPFIGLSLTYDHRALDGGPATLFLAEIKNEIEHLYPDLIE